MMYCELQNFPAISDFWLQFCAYRTVSELTKSEGSKNHPLILQLYKHKAIDLPIRNRLGITEPHLPSIRDVSKTFFDIEFY